MIKQSLTARRFTTPPNAYAAGVLMTAAFSFTFDKATLAADIIDLGVLPAGAQIVGGAIIGQNMGAVTAQVGIMSGEVGSLDVARTITTDIAAAASMNDTSTEISRISALAIAPDDTKHRSIGAKISADVAAGATKKITVLVFYHF